MIRAIEKDHVRISRTGQRLAVRLSAYPKKGAYKVSRGPNVVAAEVSCATLEEVLQHASRGYMIRMRSEILDLGRKRGRVNGLYSSGGIEVIR